ncbi:MAG: four helix bundle protein [Saprospiraceae bacterium]|nr:four helix bundle protein [Saprospiraceae bacterium]
MNGENILQVKTFEFAISIVNVYKKMLHEDKEYALSRQVLKSGTSVGAMMREAEHAESRNDFIHKMMIAQKEINEIIYWLDLLFKSDYLKEEVYNDLSQNAKSIMLLITKSISTAKNNQNRQKQ